MTVMAQPHEYHRIPSAIREGLDDYAWRGIKPGGFVRAVLENNLSGAIAKADGHSRRSSATFTTSCPRRVGVARRR